jgi:hypothetical protein
MCGTEKLDEFYEVWVSDGSFHHSKWASMSAADTEGAFFALRCIGRGTPMLIARKASVYVNVTNLNVSSMPAIGNGDEFNVKMVVSKLIYTINCRPRRVSIPGYKKLPHGEHFCTLSVS